MNIGCFVVVGGGGVLCVRGVGVMGLWGGKVEYQEGWVEYNPGYREGDEMRLHDISVRCILLVVV